MPLNLAMWIMTGAELALWTLLALLFWRKRLQVRFPALGIYLALHVVSTPLLLIALWIQSQPWGYEYYPVYYYLYWLVYISSAVLLYFVCTEIFRASLVAFPGLMRFGVVIFRWMALASLIVTISTISFKQPGTLVVTSIAYALMRAVSILELCLLAFLCLSMNALQMTVRDMAFGVALSFGMMSANDFIQSSLLSIYSTLTAPLQFFYQSGILCSLGVWAVYLALPERVRKPVLIPANSTLYRWNEIASALGHKGTQVAVQQPANSFFLTDVEKVVDTVLRRTLTPREARAQTKSGD